MTTSTNHNSTRLILTRREDWSEWYQDKKEYAEERGVWNYFNPEIEEQYRPTLPVLPDPPQPGVSSHDASYYSANMKYVQTTLKSVRQVRNKIVSGMHINIRRLIVGKARGEILKTLKMQYQTSSDEEDQFAYNKYESILKQPIKQENILTWLGDFNNAYYAIKKRNLPESNDKYVKRQFLKAISSISYSFADRQSELLHEPAHAQEDFHTLLGRYRTYLANSERLKPSGNLAFATINGQSPENYSRKERRAGPIKPCVCGLPHYFKDCWYIMKSKRNPGWKPNEETAAKVNEALQRDDEVGRKLRHLAEEDQ